MSDSGKVVSLTASEAIRLGYCDGVAGNIDQALRQGGVKEYSVSVLQLSGVDKMISFLIHPIVSGLLILLIIGGIYFEFQSPGAVFPILIAIIAMALYFAPLYLEGLAAHWEILIFLAGLVLIAVEIFVIPGFGVTGISGIFLVITGLTLAMIGNWGFDFTPVGSSKILQSFFIVIISMFVAIVSSIYFSKKLFTSHLFGGLALETVEDSSSGYVASDSAMQQWIGKKGNARSILRPAGKVEIEGEILDAVAETGYIEPGEPVVVVRFENAQLIVRRARGGV